MKRQNTRSDFHARLFRPRVPGDGGNWAFVVLPPEVSAKLPRRGRTTVSGRINGEPFTAMLEPDGQKSHWMRIDDDLQTAAGAGPGDDVHFDIAAVDQEPEPSVPEDLANALANAPASRATWEATTTVARLDWIHWITSARQDKTRAKRINDACEMLAAGKKRVCCFDPSGFYSKALGAPLTDE